MAIFLILSLCICIYLGQGSLHSSLCQLGSRLPYNTMQCQPLHFPDTGGLVSYLGQGGFLRSFVKAALAKVAMIVPLGSWFEAKATE